MASLPSKGLGRESYGSHLTNHFQPCIIYLTREPKAGWSPAAGESNLLKVAPYLTRTGALLFVFAESKNKSNDWTDHAHKGEQIAICNHVYQLLSKKSGSWSIAPSVPRVSILYFHGSFYISQYNHIVISFLGELKFPQNMGANQDNILDKILHVEWCLMVTLDIFGFFRW